MVRTKLRLLIQRRDLVAAPYRRSVRSLLPPHDPLWHIQAKLSGVRLVHLETCQTEIVYHSFNRLMSIQRVLVTGGTGFLGSEIIQALVESKKYEVTAVDINPPSLGTGTFDSVRYVRANVLEPEELQKVFNEAKPACVVHTVGVYPLGGARYGMKGRETVFEINVTGTKNVIEASKECGARALVYTSSVTVLLDEWDREFRNADETWPTGRATTLYGQSKVSRFVLYQLLSRSSLSSCILFLSLLFLDVHDQGWHAIGSSFWRSLLEQRSLMWHYGSACKGKRDQFGLLSKNLRVFPITHKLLLVRGVQSPFLMGTSFPDSRRESRALVQHPSLLSLLFAIRAHFRPQRCSLYPSSPRLYLARRDPIHTRSRR